ncbi:NAD(P)/FAD-dependent oxidoreductase [Mesobacillus maritimus]|uniref:NAD(P)/FAD-dependent oxidoreductase n=1 Tax=Mesobacillus maritimus TaxID=1643336 RepID=UPI00203F2FD5|nr:NAD(P)/FAD-dependent oxidoreductase [Mesobacillus maritimus]MCM3588212.1 NAD(P)/FAD-dependent oxidoreductase [Mesobacillus maritimus]MCM3668854.1 NAD(P)/FAD-dependent oxidoreductase [Mesobacillus maritimus]
MLYDCIIIGGGIAGLQGAIQLGRYQHKVLVIDANEGRSTICQSYHNILGYPDGVSGPELRRIGREHATRLGVVFAADRAIKVDKGEAGFTIETDNGKSYQTKRLLLSTGIVDRIPPFAELQPCLGLSVYVCPDCDGYEVANRKTIVMGAGNPGANMALTLYYWTKDIVFINHEQATVDEKLLAEMAEKNIQYIKKPISKVLAKEADFHGVVLEDGKQITAERGFVAFGGNEVKSQLAQQLGVELHNNKHILVDPRTKRTNVEHVWAAGDVVAHSEQVTIAMGDGSQAAIWIHKSLLGE